MYNACEYDNLSDHEIVNAILRRDKEITFNILYKKYYPLFNSIFNKYFTDCENTVEFINQVYVLIMTPGKVSKRSPLSTFGFRCTFGMWLKLVAQNYCIQKFKKRILKEDTPNNERTDRTVEEPVSINMDSINKKDINIVLDNMKNQRYRMIIKLRYLDCKSNEETAKVLGMTMSNYYNKHKLAKEQLVNELKKEGIL